MRDAYGILADSQSVTSDGATTNIIDCGDPDKDYGKHALGAGNNNVHVLLESMATTADDTLTVTLEHSTNDSDWSTLMTLVSELDFNLSTALDPQELVVSGVPRDHYRYLRGYYDLASSSLGAEMTIYVGP